MYDNECMIIIYEYMLVYITYLHKVYIHFPFFHSGVLHINNKPYQKEPSKK